ncbi:MAG TPA: SMP-30/gluconolactonase/LRE family protein [Mycobacteriales bacterium]|nr:SMP-30/gluconolactonase/LRE family protein [Mycobacteriales bacterium]
MIRARAIAILAALVALLAPGLAQASVPGVPTVSSTPITKAGYPEGPVRWRGHLYYVEYGSSRILRLDGHTPHEFRRDPACGASALIAVPGHRLLVTCYDDNTLAVVDQHGRTAETITHDSRGRPFLGPNDFARDRFGGIYFSASGVYSAGAPSQGTVYYLAPGGGIRPVARHIHYSNGLAVTPDGRHLLITAMLSHRILAYDIVPGGGLVHRRTFLRTDRIAPPASTAGPLSGPDGMKIGPDGRLYIAQNGSGRILVVDPYTRRLCATIEVAAPYVTNMAFGPHHSVYMTSSFDADHPPYPGAVYRAHLPG